MPCGSAYADRFAAALRSEIVSRAKEIEGTSGTDTLYIGGGTPSVLPLSVLQSVTGLISSIRGCGRYEEFTIEVNPEDIVEKGEAYAEGLLEAGVDRVSMGVQSLDDKILRFMNRRHDAARAREAYRILRNAGFKNISVDLIFGIPDMDDSIWENTLEETVSGLGTGQAPEHVSAYQLSVEPESALAEMLASGKFAEAPEEQCSRQYHTLCSMLSAAGYRHYEISNFAIPGHEAIHNSGYWRHVPYAGFGPAAHSLSVAPAADEAGAFRGKVYRRTWNSPSLKSYLEASSAGDFSSIRGGETLTAEQVSMEKVMLALRTDSGIEESFLRSVCSPSAIDSALSAGVLARCRRSAGPSSLHGRLFRSPDAGCSDSGQTSFIRIPEDRLFVSDNIIADLVSVE